MSLVTTFIKIIYKILTRYFSYNKIRLNSVTASTTTTTNYYYIRLRVFFQNYLGRLAPER